MSQTAELSAPLRSAGGPPPFWRVRLGGGRAPSLGPLALAAAVLGVGVYVAVFALYEGKTSYNILGVLWVLPVLLALSYPILRLITRAQPDPWIRRAIVLAFLVKVAAGFANYFVQYVVYKGVVDANQYDQLGQKLYTAWRQGHYTLAPIAHIAGDSSLTFARIATGVVYMFIGPSRMAGFVVFAWFGFWGLYFFLRAFQVAFPAGDHRRYAALLLFFPSMVFWTSAIGKDSWMVFMLGLFTYGAARVYRYQRGGFILLGVGLFGTAICRPQISLLAILPMGAGYAVRRSGGRAARLAPITKILGLSILIALAGVAAYRFQSQFKISGINSGTINSTLKRASKDSATGQATFNGSVTPLSVALLLFRPLPNEVTSVTSAASSLEGLALVGLAIAWRRRLLTAFRLAFKDAYVAFCGAYIAAFCVAFSAISNYGTLARERAQVMPMVFVLLCLPPTPYGWKRLRRGAGWYRGVPVTAAQAERR